MTEPTLPPGPPATLSDAEPPGSREELMRLLDRETAIARATEGRLAVLVLELRRVDRLHALLKGPAPATTMSLVLERLRKALRPEDRLAALSDEQVCIVLPRLAHQSQAVLAAVKLLRALDRPITYEGGSAVLRPCIGVATLPEHGFDPAELLMAADVSRSIAQRREEGYHVFSAEDTIETHVYKGLDMDLERAIRANELALHYQPQVDVATGRLVAAEALLRWRHEKAGEIAPMAIVGIAERTGLGGTLTYWVLNAALREFAQWRGAGAAPRLSINISSSTLGDRELPAVVDQALKTWNVPPEQLTLEMAESPTLVEAERSTAILTRLDAVGVRLSLDDFGSGFSSLVQMGRLPVDELKIDRPFVAGLTRGKSDAAVVRSAIDIARHFGLAVVAEGVETAECRAALTQLGCDLAQGFLVSPPLAPGDFRAWCARHGGAV